MPGSGTQPGLFSSRPWIRAGSVEDIRAFLKDAAREGMRSTKTDEDQDISVGVLDRSGAPDHPANNKQTRDAKAVHRLLEKLTPR